MPLPAAFLGRRTDRDSRTRAESRRRSRPDQQEFSSVRRAPLRQDDGQIRTEVNLVSLAAVRPRDPQVGEIAFTCRERDRLAIRRPGGALDLRNGVRHQGPRVASRDVNDVKRLAKLVLADEGDAGAVQRHDRVAVEGRAANEHRGLRQSMDRR